MSTLREGLVNTLNEINKLIRAADDDDEEEKLRRWRRIYFALLDEVVRQEIDATTHEFKEAVEALGAAQKQAVEAKESIDKIADAINKAAKAAKAVDTIVKVGVDAMA
jgi:hypothetical protein